MKTTTFTKLATAFALVGVPALASAQSSASAQSTTSTQGDEDQQQPSDQQQQQPQQPYSQQQPPPQAQQPSDEEQQSFGAEQGLNEEQQEHMWHGIQPRQLQGRVVSLREMQIRGMSQPDLMAVIQTSNGERRLVDIGPQSQVQQLRLSVGDQVTVKGREVRPRPFVIGDQIQTKNQTLSINRQQERRELGQLFQKRRQQQQQQQQKGG